MRPELLGNQIGFVENAEPLADQAVFTNTVPKHQRHVVDLPDQLESSISTWRRARSSEASSCWLGEVEV